MGYPEKHEATQEELDALVRKPVVKMWLLEGGGLEVFVDIGEGHAALVSSDATGFVTIELGR